MNYAYKDELVYWLLMQAAQFNTQIRCADVYAC